MGLLLIGVLFTLNLTDHKRSDSPDKSSDLTRDWKIYEDDRYKITLNYPQTWDYIVEDIVWGRSITLLPENYQNSRSKITINIEPINELTTLEEYSEDLKRAILRNNRSSIILEEEDTVMLNTQAREILYEFERDNERVRKMAIVVLRNKISYVFYYEASPDNFLNFKIIARDIEKSLRFLN
jgi:hypothetical protein